MRRNGWAWESGSDKAMHVGEWLSQRCFGYVHGNYLVYNTCWEDPRLDREALALGSEDEVMVITSAGCNALEYLLDEPARVHAVDLNRRQNALLELKVAGIRRLDFEDFFELFGKGRVPAGANWYQHVLRGELSPAARDYWDDRFAPFFQGEGKPGSFYFRGTTGLFAWWINRYIDRVAKVRGPVMEILAANSVVEQRSIYERHLRAAFWGRAIRWCVSRDVTLALLGVPRAQRRQLERDFTGGVAGFVEESIETVFTRLPLQDNYFWRVYLTGQYTQDCCPGYLQPENFQRLREGAIDRLTTYTMSVQAFLERYDRPISRFVLLDHMDWMASSAPELLQAEWQAILRRAAPGARVLWRGAGTSTEHVDRLRVVHAGGTRELGELLTYHHDWSHRLAARDRVHTYAHFAIADLAA